MASSNGAGIALTGVQIVFVFVAIAILILGFLWAICQLDDITGLDIPDPPWCGGGAPPLGGDDDEEEEEPPICEDLDDKLMESAPTYMIYGEALCEVLGGNWLFESKIVGCFDPFIPGRIYCPPIVTDPRWVDFAIACRDAGGYEICSRKFAGCVCPDWPMAAAECGWSYDSDNGLFCGGTCDQGSCTELEGECFCKGDDHLYCDEYLTYEGLGCFGYCENEEAFCEYREGVCDCWEFV